MGIERQSSACTRVTQWRKLNWNATPGDKYEKEEKDEVTYGTTLRTTKVFVEDKGSNKNEHRTRHDINGIDNILS